MYEIRCMYMKVKTEAYGNEVYNADTYNTSEESWKTVQRKSDYNLHGTSYYHIIHPISMCL
jgi:hypothetical protein